jgi:hypothetical protein
MAGLEGRAGCPTHSRSVRMSGLSTLPRLSIGRGLISSAGGLGLRKQTVDAEWALSGGWATLPVRGITGFVSKPKRGCPTSRAFREVGLSPRMPKPAFSNSFQRSGRRPAILSPCANTTDRQSTDTPARLRNLAFFITNIPCGGWRTSPACKFTPTYLWNADLEITGGAPLLALFGKGPPEPPTPFASALGAGRRGSEQNPGYTPTLKGLPAP